MWPEAPKRLNEAQHVELHVGVSASLFGLLLSLEHQRRQVLLERLRVGEDRLQARLCQWAQHLLDDGHHFLGDWHQQLGHVYCCVELLRVSVFGGWTRHGKRHRDGVSIHSGLPRACQTRCCTTGDYDYSTQQSRYLTEA